MYPFYSHTNKNYNIYKNTISNFTTEMAISLIMNILNLNKIKKHYKSMIFVVKKFTLLMCP